MQHLVEFNRTKCSVEELSLVELFQRNVQLNPSAIAVEYKNISLTYKQLDTISNQIARHLVEQFDGIDLRGKNIAFCLERDEKMIALIIAILKVGAAYIPFEPTHPDERLNYVLEDCSACLLVTDEASAGRQSICREVVLENAIGGDDSAAFNIVKTSPEDLAYIMYTSGSTGQPKGVLVTQKGITRLVLDSREINVSPEAVFAQAGNIAFDASTLEIWAPLLHGARIAVIPYEVVIDSIALQHELKDKRVTDAWFTVALFNQLATDNPNAFGGLNNLMVGGDALNPKTIAAVLNSETPPKQVWNGYGPTENTTFTTMHRIQAEDCDRISIPIGKPISNTTCYVLDENLCPVEHGHSGELYTSGLGLAKGYLNKEDKTRETFVRNPFYDNETVRSETPATEIMYKTGDRVRWLDDGSIEFIGRVDNQVKIRGFRLELGEVEARLTDLEGVEQAVVIAQEHNGQKQLVAYCVSDLSSTDIQRQFREKVPTYMVPSQLMCLDTLPLTANGKVDKRALPAADFALVGNDEIVPLETSMEKNLASIWSEILSIEPPISRNGNFFELGGHSLQVVKVKQQLLSKMGVEVRIADFFKFPILSELASYIETLKCGSIGIANNAIQRRDPEHQLIPLSFEQQRLWVIEKTQGPSALYHIPSAFKLDGNLSPSALEAAFEKLISRHESLHVRIVESNGQGFQQVGSCDFSLPVVSVESENALNKALEDDAERPFDLANEPLLRVRLYRYDGAYYLLVNIHHIITDGWSMGNFYSDLKAFYLQEIGESNAALDDLHIQYTDYCAWQKEQNFSSSLEFWKSSLDGVKPLELPTSSSSEVSNETIVSSVTLGDTFSKGLEQLAIRNQTGLFNILYSGLSIVLSRYCSQQDVPIASIWANRPVKELEKQIGFFANTIILRTQVNEQQQVEDFIRNNNQMLMESFEHGSAPLDKVLSMLDIPRNGDQHPLCSVAFVLQNTDGGDGKSLDLPGVTSSQHILKPELAKFDLLFNVTFRKESGLKVEASFRKGYWSEEIQSQLLSNYENVLKAMTSGASKVNDISLLSESDVKHHLVELNKTSAQLEELDLISHFQHRVQQYPNSPAVLFKDRVLTYQQLDKLSDNVAHALLECTHRQSLQGSSIAFSVDRNDAMIALILGIIKVGAHYVPFDPSHPDERLHYVLQDSGSCLLVTEMAHQGRQNICTEVMLDQLLTDQDFGPFESVHQAIDDVAYIMYTSGSTGQPKGVKVPVRGITRLVVECPTITVSPDSVYAQAGNIAFDASTLEIWAPLLNGASVVVIPYETVIDSNALQEELKSKRVTDAWFTVALFNQLAADNPNAFGNLNNLMVGGDALNPKSIAAVLNSATPPKQIWNGYGPTENTTFTTMHPIQLTDCGRRSIPIGKPISNTTCYVLNEHLQPQPVGVPGELYTSGLGLADGYLNKPEKTKETFVVNPFFERKDVRANTPANSMMYKTGDRVRWLSDGSLEFIGRVDNQVKIRGFRLELGEVEGLLTQIPEVEQAVVIAVNHNGQKQLFAYCVSGLNQADILKSLRSNAPAYMIPSGMMVMDSFPLTANGKVDKRKLPEANFAVAPAQQIVEPRTETEKVLVGIWKGLLKDTNEVSADDHFFEVGGHSLLVIQMIDQINKQLGIRLEVKTVFSSPVLSELASILDGDTKNDDTDDAQMCIEDQWLKLEKPFISSNDVEIKRALLTGATGFLGAHLLHELQNQMPNVTVHCLVRGEDESSCMSKIRSTCQKYRLDVDYERVEVLCGDLNESKFGLSTEVWGELEQSIDAIYHCGAWVNHLHSYSTLRNANVISTLDFLELCQQGSPKKMFYVSTMSSAPTDDSGIREKFVAEAPNADNGYIQSKWVSERLVEQAFEKGLFGTIYRMGNITGCTRHGASNADINHTLNLIKGCLQMGAAPDWASYNLDISPADVLASLLVSSSMTSKHSQEIVNLGYLSSVNWRQKIEHLVKKGHDLQFVCPKEWAEKWVANIDTDNALYPFKSFYLEPKLHQEIVVEREYVEQSNLSLNISNLLDTYYSYWNDIGFIEREISH
nr:non-ribosomal peptide synthetase [Vibrio sinus]